MISSANASKATTFPLRLWLPLALLILGGTLALFETSGLDLAIQDRFYDFTAKRWIIGEDDALPRVLFYQGPKVLFVALAVGLIAALIRGWKWERKRIVAVIVSLASLPIAVSVLKDATDVYFPSQVRRYGGNKPYARLFDAYPEHFLQVRKGTGHGFPAAHASGGFALMGLAFLARSRKARRICIAVGIALGWVLGLYQMARGMHYMSHTLVSCGLACLIIPLWGRVFRL